MIRVRCGGRWRGAARSAWCAGLPRAAYDANPTKSGPARGLNRRRGRAHFRPPRYARRFGTPPEGLEGFRRQRPPAPGCAAVIIPGRRRSLAPALALALEKAVAALADAGIPGGLGSAGRELRGMAMAVWRGRRQNRNGAAGRGAVSVLVGKHQFGLQSIRGNASPAPRPAASRPPRNPPPTAPGGAQGNPAHSWAKKNCRAVAERSGSRPGL